MRESSVWECWFEAKIDYRFSCERKQSARSKSRRQVQAAAWLTWPEPFSIFHLPFDICHFPFGHLRDINWAINRSTHATIKMEK
jgi:hypothetical protein